MTVVPAVRNALKAPAGNGGADCRACLVYKLIAAAVDRRPRHLAQHRLNARKDFGPNRRGAGSDRFVAAAADCRLAFDAAPRNDLRAAAEDRGADRPAAAVDFQKSARGYRRRAGDSRTFRRRFGRTPTEVRADVAHDSL